jgi:hypothetical protein
MKELKHCSAKQFLYYVFSFSLFLTANIFAVKGKINSRAQGYRIFERYHKSSVTVAVIKLSLKPNSMLYNS